MAGEHIIKYVEVRRRVRAPSGGSSRARKSKGPFPLGSVDLLSVGDSAQRNGKDPRKLSPIIVHVVSSIF